MKSAVLGLSWLFKALRELGPLATTCPALSPLRSHPCCVFPALQSYCCPRTFAPAVPSAWDTFPPHPHLAGSFLIFVFASNILSSEAAPLSLYLNSI